MNELYHHGILGQKWGVRRFQNPDGTLTEAGKKRYAENYSESQRQQDRSVYSKGAERRINKRMLNGENIVSARSKEADRINAYKKRANTARKVTKAIAGPIGGVAGALAYMDLIEKIDKLNMQEPEVKDLEVAGAAFVGGALAEYSFPDLAADAVMLSGGYNPNKRR